MKNNKNIIRVLEVFMFALIIMAMMSMKAKAATAQEVANGLDWNNATLEVGADEDNPGNTLVRVNIPLKETFPGIIYQCDMNYDSDKTDGMGMTMYNWECQAYDTLSITSSLNPIWFDQAETITYSLRSMSISVDGGVKYLQEEGESGDDVAIVTFPDSIKKFKVEPTAIETVPITLNAQATTLTKRSRNPYSFTAPTEGDYTFYITGPGSFNVYKVNEGKLGWTESVYYPSSFTRHLSAGDKFYFLVDDGGSEEDDFIAFGVTNEPAEKVTVTDIAIVGNKIVAQGCDLQVNVTTSSTSLRKIEVSFESEGNIWDYCSCEANKKAIWGNSILATYHINGITVYDELGRSSNIDKETLKSSGINVDSLTLECKSFNDCLASRKEEGITEVEIGGSISSDNTCIIPEGMTANADYLSLGYNTVFQVSGTLLVRGNLYVYENANLSVGENGSIVSASTSFQSSEIQVDDYKDLIKGTEKGAKLSGYKDYNYVEYTWTGSKWKSSDQWFPDLDEMMELALYNGDDNVWSSTGEPIINESGEKSYWYTREIKETGVYNFETSNMDGCWMERYIKLGDEIKNIYDEGNRGLNLVAGETVCVQLATYDSDGVPLVRLKKMPADALTASLLAEKMLIKNSTIEVKANDTGKYNEVTVSIPFTGMEKYSDLRAGVNLEDKDSNVSFYIPLKKNRNVLTGTKKISYSRCDSSYEVALRHLYIYLNDDDDEYGYSIHFSENPDNSAIQSGLISTCYLPDTQVPSCTLKFTGRFALGVGENSKISIPVGEEIKVKFTPPSDDCYMLVSDNEKVKCGFEESWREENDEDWNTIDPKDFKKGTTYNASLWTYENEEEESPETIGIYMLLDKAVPTVTSVKMPETMACSQYCPLEMTIESENGVKDIGIELTELEGDRPEDYNRDIYTCVDVVNEKYEGNKLTAQMYISEAYGVSIGEKLYIDSIYIYDKYNKCTVLKKGDPVLKGLSTEYVTVKSVVESTGSSNFNYISMGEDDHYTIPSGGSVRVDSLYLNDGSSLTLNGNLSSSEYVYIQKGATLTDSNKIIVEYEGRVFDEAGLNYFVGKDTDSIAWVEIENVGTTKYRWNGSAWKVSSDDENYPVAHVIDLINELPETAGIDDEEAVTAARAAYTDLTDAQKKKITADLLTKLETAESQVAQAKADKAEADKVIASINALPNPAGVDDESTVTAARTAYSKLTDAQKKLVSATVRAKLTTAESQVSQAKTDKAEADKVIASINALPASAGIDDESKVTAARAAYNKLTADQKKLVNATVLAKLTTAESQVSQAKTDKAEADKVIASINNLPETAGLNDEEAVTAAREAYNKLTEEQKKNVSADVLAKLETAETQVNQAKADKAEEAKVIENITNLPAAAGLDDEAAVVAAREAYEKLTEEQKKSVSAEVLAKLEAAETQVNQAKADKAKEAQVIENISNLPATAGLDDEAAVVAAREAYEKLTEEQKKSISAEVLAKLEAAEAQVKQAKAEKAEAEKAEANKAEADKVMGMINNLPASVRINDKATVKAAREAYEKLTEEQKKLVSAEVLSKLTNAESTLEKTIIIYDPPAYSNPVTALSALDSTVVLKKGAKKTITVYVTEKDPAETTTDKATVTSSKNNIATASARNLTKGKLTFKVKGLKAGKSNITAKVGSKTVTVKVTVLKKANKAKSVKAVKKQVKVKKNKTKTIVVKVTSANKKLATTDVVKATSGKSKVAAVTKISTVKGKIKVTVKALKKGKSTLTVKVGKKKAKIKVNVQ